MRFLILFLLTHCAAIADGEVQITVISEPKPGIKVWVNTKVRVSFLKGKNGPVIETVEKRRDREQVLTFDTVPGATHVRVEVTPNGYYEAEKTLRLSRGKAQHTFKVKRYPTVRFKVIDAVTKKPIKGAEVKHKYRNSLGNSSGGTRTTKKDGMYERKMSYKGKQTFTFSAFGYESVELELPLEKLPKRVKKIKLLPKY